MKRFLLIILTFSLAMGLFSCAGPQKDNVPCCKTGVIRDTKFGSFFADISIEDFNALGFAFGDSVNVKLGSGTEYTDVPYYNGYYVLTGSLLLCGYPGYEHVKIGLNNGDDLWEKLGMDETMTVEITLNEKGKYLLTQNTLDTVYTNVRTDYASDEVFANYRALSGGNLKENIFFRSASPCDDQYNRAAYSDKLMKADGVTFVLDLADDENDIAACSERADFASSHYKKLYDEGNVALLDLGSNYRSDAYKKSVADGLRKLLSSPGPYLTHCTEGKDRTGFVCILIESLCSATYGEMEADYMITYDNYYHISKTSQADRYEAIRDLKYLDMVLYLADGQDIGTADYVSAAEKYLSEGGMTAEEIASLKALLTK